MRYFGVMICLVFAFTLLACEQQSTKTLDVQTIIRRADSLMRGTDSASYKINLLKASSMLKQAILQEPNNNLVRQLQVTTYTFMRTPDSVLLIYQGWVKREPHSLEPNLKSGLLYHVLKEEAKARPHFEKVKKILLSRMKAINKNTTDRDLHLLLNMSYDFFLIGEREIAQKIISDIYKAHPNHSRAKNAFLKFNSFDREIEISRQVGF